MCTRMCVPAEISGHRDLLPTLKPNHTCRIKNPMISTREMDSQLPSILMCISTEQYQTEAKPL